MAGDVDFDRIANGRTNVRERSDRQIKHDGEDHGWDCRPDDFEQRIPVKGCRSCSRPLSVSDECVEKKSLDADEDHRRDDDNHPEEGGDRRGV